MPTNRHVYNNAPKPAPAPKPASEPTPDISGPQLKQRVQKENQVTNLEEFKQLVNKLQSEGKLNNVNENWEWNFNGTISLEERKAIWEALDK